MPRADHGELVETAWWVYPIEDAPGIGVLALAADLRHLREQGPGLSMGSGSSPGPTAPPAATPAPDCCASNPPSPTAPPAPS
ncbi:hypothetical protein, partial [Actinomadura sp. CNU-125]|uniref:hypothetical protein n=1 Tax=Actinomadura sp. CNU-125 TaxID=1904961 RepID=UPI0021CC5365